MLSAASHSIAQGSDYRSPEKDDVSQIIESHRSHLRNGIRVQVLVSEPRRCVFAIDACSAQMVHTGELD